VIQASLDILSTGVRGDDTKLNLLLKNASKITKIITPFILEVIEYMLRS